jgi:hypothetical protein
LSTTPIICSGDGKFFENAEEDFIFSDEEPVLKLGQLSLNKRTDRQETSKENSGASNFSFDSDCEEEITPKQMFSGPIVPPPTEETYDDLVVPKEGLNTDMLHKATSTRYAKIERDKPTDLPNDLIHLRKALLQSTTQAENTDFKAAVKIRI